jgi:hypothetical protein
VLSFERTVSTATGVSTYKKNQGIMLRDKDRKKNKRSWRRKTTWEKRRKSGVFISLALILR